MELQQEIELWYVIPAIRRALVLELKNKGIKQKTIAKLFDITEPTVSHYINDKRAASCCEEFSGKDLQDLIKKSAETISHYVDIQPAVAIREINRICKYIKEQKIICKIHKKKNTTINECNICYEL